MLDYKIRLINYYIIKIQDIFNKFEKENHILNTMYMCYLRTQKKHEPKQLHVW